MQKMSNAEKIKYWIQKLNELEGSGLSTNEWCKQNDIAPSTLIHWRNKFQNKKRKPKDKQKNMDWIKIDPGIDNSNNCNLEIPKEPTTNMLSNIKIQYEGFLMEIPNGCNIEYISNILRALKLL